MYGMISAVGLILCSYSDFNFEIAEELWVGDQMSMKYA